MRKILSVLAAVVFSAGSASAANIPFFSGIFDPSNLPGVINQLVQSINSNGPGLVAAQPGPIASIATTVEQILAQTTIPTGTFTLPGQALRIKCGGVSTADTNTKQVGIYFGSVIVSSAAFAGSGSNWSLDLMVSQATLIPTANSVYVGDAMVATGSGTATVNVAAGNDTTDNLSTGVTVKCDMRGGTSAIGEVSLDTFTVEQVK